MLCAAAVAGGTVGLAALSPAYAADPPNPFLAELHYDNDSTDVGEFVEVQVPDGTSVEGWSVVLYNGNGGAPYATFDLTDSAVADGVVVVDGSAGIQNGAPDGLALVRDDGSVVEFLSYEGAFTAVGGDADGLTSTDIAVEEGAGTPVGASLSRTSDGSWVVTTTSSRGAVNDGLAGSTGFGSLQPPGGDGGGGGTTGPDTGCDADATLISAVQGAGAASPLDGQAVTVNAVVTQVEPGLDGYFLQEEAADDDGDPATSEGIFVFDGDADVAVGQQLAVTGTVDEFFDLTELTDVTATEVCATDVTVPAATDLGLPATEEERESLEGMQVTATDLTVSNLFDTWRFGEVGLSVGGVLRTPTDVAPIDGGAEQVAQENFERGIVLDDAGDRDAARAKYLGTAESPDAARLGDTIASVTGALSYGFGKWLLEPTVLPDLVEQPRPDAPDLDATGARVATFNVLNLFNGNGDGTGFPTSRGADTYEDYLAQLDGIVTAINGLDADVVGIIEVENDYGDGAQSSIAQLVDALDAADDGTADGSWAYVDPGAALVDGKLGSDEIAVGILYRPETVSPIGDAATVDLDEFLREGDGSEAEKNRQPIAQTLDIDGEVQTLVVNHLKSKGSSCAGLSTADGYTGGGAFDDDPDSDLLGSCNNTRVYAANRLLDWLDTKPTGTDDPDYVLGGDFNAYSQEPPIQVLRDAGYVDLIGELGDDAPTYSFGGAVGRLDDLFASPSAARSFDDAAAWRINSPEPYVYLYFPYSGDPYDAAGPYASSDHDPVIASLVARETPPVADTVPPFVRLLINKRRIFKPNGRMVPLKVLVQVQDEDDSPRVRVRIRSSEPDRGLYRRDRPNDVQGNLRDGFSVRAERAPRGYGRIYTVIARVTDEAGNRTIAERTVLVPKRQKRR